jgi:hypothetical protein
MRNLFKSFVFLSLILVSFVAQADVQQPDYSCYEAKARAGVMLSANVYLNFESAVTGNQQKPVVVVSEQGRLGRPVKKTFTVKYLSRTIGGIGRVVTLSARSFVLDIQLKQRQGEYLRGNLVLDANDPFAPGPIAMVCVPKQDPWGTFPVR